MTDTPTDTPTETPRQRCLRNHQEYLHRMLAAVIRREREGHPEAHRFRAVMEEWKGIGEAIREAENFDPGGAGFL